MEKKRYDIEIADVQLAIVSDEREDFVMRLVRELDEKIREMTGLTKRASVLDAAILCALDYNSDRLKAEKRVRNLEAQIALYDANLRRMRDENNRLKETLLGKATINNREETEAAVEISATIVEAEADPAQEEKSPAASQISIGDVAETAGRDEKLRQISYLFRRGNDLEAEKEDADQNGFSDEDCAKKDDKLRQIENLLRNKD